MVLKNKRKENKRKEVESWENKSLAPWAYLSKWASRKHRMPDDSYRTRFQVDRDRILNCAFFRQLADKTQVYNINLSDFCRRRLTHTLEVHRLSMTLSEYLYTNDLFVSAIAYGHDIGHVPFGHAGENAISKFINSHSKGGLQGGFSHSQHSLRVTYFLCDDYIEDGYFGLNLTNEVRQSILKHTKIEDSRTNQENKLWPNRPTPVEGQIVQKADLIASVIADFEDATSVYLVDYREIIELEGLVEYLNAYRKNKRKKIFKADISSYHSLKSKLTWALMEDVIRESLRILEEGFPQAHLFIAGEDVVHSVEDVKKYICSPENLGSFPGDPRNPNYIQEWEYPNVVRLSDPGAKIASQLWELRKDKIWDSPIVMRMNKKGEEIILYLAEIFYEEPKLMYHKNRPYSSDLNLLKKRYRMENISLEEHLYGENQTYERRVLVKDYIACLSDSSAVDEYERLKNPYRRVVSTV